MCCRWLFEHYGLIVYLLCRSIPVFLFDGLGRFIFSGQNVRMIIKLKRWLTWNSPATVWDVWSEKPLRWVTNKRFENQFWISVTHAHLCSLLSHRIRTWPSITFSITIFIHSLGEFSVLNLKPKPNGWIWGFYVDLISSLSTLPPGPSFHSNKALLWLISGSYFLCWISESY